MQSGVPEMRLLFELFGFLLTEATVSTPFPSRAFTIELDFVFILTSGDWHATQSECSVEGWP
jgi:hypothetical protein